MFFPSCREYVIDSYLIVIPTMHLLKTPGLNLTIILQAAFAPVDLHCSHINALAYGIEHKVLKLGIHSSCVFR